MTQRIRLTTIMLLLLAIQKLSAQCPVIDFTAMDEFCSLDNGLIDITVTLGTEPYTYLWSNGEVTEDISGLDAGNYVVTVTDATGCTDEEAMVIIDNSPPVISFTTTIELCKQEDGAIDITVTDGAEPYTYMWNNGETTEDIENLGAAVYSVTVTDANGCSTVELISISSNNPPVTITATIVPNTSCDPDNGNGSITLTVDPYPLSPAGTPYLITWSNGETGTLSITDLVGGGYLVDLDGGGVCDGFGFYVVEDLPPDPPNLDIISQPSDCGLDNGSAEIAIFGGLAPYSILWSNGATTSAIDDLAIGTFSVTVTDDNSCTAETSIEVLESDNTFNITGLVVANTSCELPNGSIDIDVNPPGTYDYEWSNGETTEDLSELAEGTYTVTATNDLGCTSMAEFTVSDFPDIPIISFTTTIELCKLEDGAIDITVTDGVEPYTYMWSNGETTEDIADLGSAVYSVTVTDANGCSTVEFINVSNDNPPVTITATIVPNTSCDPDNGNGSITLTVDPYPLSPAGTPYLITWSNGETGTLSITDLVGGGYLVDLDGGGQCDGLGFYVVEDLPPNPPVLSIDFTPADCGDDNGTATVTISGGLAPYNILWSNGETSPTINDLSVGTYSVTVTDANSCSIENSVVINESDITFDVTGLVVDNTSCASPNGSIDIDVNPIGAYDYEWSTGETSEDLNGLLAGNYNVTVTNALGCSSIAEFTVTSISNDPEIISEVTPAVCGVPIGTINITVLNGQGPFTFLWSNGQTTEDLQDLDANTYSVTVTDSNGCSADATVEITDETITLSAEATVNNNTSCALPNGSLDITITPIGTYTYLWSNGETTEDIMDLTGGNYMVTVSAGAGCDFIFDYDVQNLSSSPIIESELTSTVCGESDGEINLTINGGNLPYSFDWSNGATSEDLTGILSGDYFVTVTDAQGCSTIGNFEVLDEVINIDITGTTIANSSCISNNGSITIDVLPSGSYTYLWSNGAITEDLDNLAEGIYSVTVTISGTCFEESTFVVQNQSSTLAVDGIVNNILCFGENTGSISIDVSGGVPPYQYEWLPSIPENPEDPSNLLSGEYTVVVTDASDCQIAQNFSITGPDNAIQLNCTQSENVSMIGMTDGQAIVNINGGTSPYSISWAPGGSEINIAPGDFVINDLSENTYDVIVTDANGCESLCNFSITSDDCPEASIAPPDFLTCLDTQIELIAASTVADSDYSWSTLDGNILGLANTSTIIVDQAGQYMLIVEASDCLDTSFVTVFDLSTEVAAMIISTPSMTLDCTQESINLEGSVDGAEFVDYIWYYENEVISIEQSFSLDQPGTYTLTTIDQITGCEDSEQILIDEDIISPILDVDTPPMLNCSDTLVTLTGTSTMTGVDLMWISIDNLDSLVLSNNGAVNVDKPGTYHLIAIADNGCSSSTSVVVQQNVISPEVNAGEDQMLDCNQTFVELVGNSDMPTAAYLWSADDPNIVISNPTTSNLVVNQPGTYSLEVTNVLNNCTATDDVLVDQTGNILQPELEITPPNCYAEQNGSILVNSDSAYGPYLYSLDALSNGDNNLFTSLSAGDHDLVILDGLGCMWNTTVNIPMQPSISVDIGTDLQANIGDSVIIDLSHSVPDDELDTILWFPSDLVSCINQSCTAIAFTAEEQITINVTVIDIYGCEGYAELVVNVDKDSDIFIPNVFSPDGDGTNDNLTIFSNNAALKVNKFQIFSRWGESVLELFNFAPNDPTYGWDGRHHGQLVNPDVYVWYAEVQYENGQVQVLTGDVTVIK